MENEKNVPIDDGVAPPDSPPADYETVIAVPDLSDVPAPPTYEPPPLEGVPKTHENAGDESPPPYSESQTTQLLYADFLARLIQKGDAIRPPKYDTFKTTMSIVNDWLRKSPHYRVLRLESIERKVTEKGEAEAETTVYHQSANGTTSYIRGVRLWLTPNTENRPVQQFWYVTVVPKASWRQVPVAMRVGMGMMGMGTVGVAAIPMCFPRFENLDAMLDKLNTRLQEDPIPGEISSIETMDTKYTGGWNSGPVDTETTYWTDTNSSYSLYLKTLRIFFTLGQKKVHKIGIQDFPPVCKAAGTSTMLPRFEDFSTVFEEASSWISNQTGIKITNLQTINMRIERNLLKAKYNLDTRQMDYHSGYFESVFLKTLRVPYLVSPSGGGLTLTSVPLCLSSKAFIPIKIKHRTCETTAETVQHLNTWLSCSGARVIGVDTLHHIFCPESKRLTDTERAVFTVKPSYGTYWIAVLRLYIDGTYNEPPDFTQTPGGSQSSSSCCVIV